jgi:cob(I)alamin adenosyltransferase
MARLYTKTGDDGTTGLFDGSRVSKHDLRVCAYGDVDELNSQIGAAIALMAESGPSWAKIRERLRSIQHELFVLGAELATPDAAGVSVPRVTEAMCRRLEGFIDEASAAAPALKVFVLPGGHKNAAQLHICRTVCRRAERGIVRLSAQTAINPQVVIYLNRLSDLLFAWAREANHIAGVGDVPWQKPD